MDTNGPEEDGELAALLGRHGVSKTAEGRGPVEGGAGQAFAIAQNRFLGYKAKAKLKRAGIRKFIKPENALVVVRRLPEEGGTTHCILRGDFVLADLLPYLLEEGWTCAHLRIATLGMSEANAVLLAKLVNDGKVGKITLVLSHYFEQVNKSTVYFEVRRVLEGIAEFAVMRSHAKVICIARERAGAATEWLVMEGSANLRSSDNLEQLTIFNDKEVHDFHAEWIDEVLASPPET